MLKQTPIAFVCVLRDVQLTSYSRLARDRTGSFIGCAAVVLELSTVSHHLQTSKLKNSSFLSLVRYDSGIVINDSTNSVVETGNISLHVADSGIVASETFDAFQKAVNFSAPWTHESVNEAFQSLLLECQSGPTIAIPLPVPPKKYDPNYRPTFILIDAIGTEVFDAMAQMNAQIQNDVVRIIVTSLGLGLFGFLLLLSIIWCVSRMLTQPLLWMDETAGRIINNDAQRADIMTMIHSGSDHGEDESAASPTQRSAASSSAATFGCAPKSEVNELVQEFRVMIQNFSGSGPAEVAETPLQEIRNDLTWHSEFSHLYLQRPEAAGSSFSTPPPTSTFPPNPAIPLPSKSAMSVPSFRSVAGGGGAMAQDDTRIMGNSFGTKRTADEESSSKVSPKRSSSDASPTSQEPVDVSMTRLEAHVIDEGHDLSRSKHADQAIVTPELQESAPRQNLLPQTSLSCQGLDESTGSQLIVPGTS